jgi:hypothetical protein
MRALLPFLALLIAVHDCANAQSYSDVRGCWLKAVDVTSERATIRFGRGANGFGAIMNSNDETIIIARFRVEHEDVFVESSEDNYNVKKDAVQIRRDQLATLTGFHAGCRIAWEIQDGRPGVLVSTSDTSGPGFRPHSLSTFLPLK